MFNKNNVKRSEGTFEGMVFDDPDYKTEVVDLGTNIFYQSRLCSPEKSQGRGDRGGRRGGRGGHQKRR